jgi:hypothetical protein
MRPASRGALLNPGAHGPHNVPRAVTAAAAKKSGEQQGAKAGHGQAGPGRRRRQCLQRRRAARGRPQARLSGPPRAGRAGDGGLAARPSVPGRPGCFSGDPRPCTTNCPEWTKRMEAGMTAVTDAEVLLYWPCAFPVGPSAGVRAPRQTRPQRMPVVRCLPALAGPARRLHRPRRARRADRAAPGNLAVQPDARRARPRRAPHRLTRPPRSCSCIVDRRRGFDLVADAVQAGHQHRGEGQVRVAGGGSAPVPWSGPAASPRSRNARYGRARSGRCRNPWRPVRSPGRGARAPPGLHRHALLIGQCLNLVAQPSGLGGLDLAADRPYRAGDAAGSPRSPRRRFRGPAAALPPEPRGRRGRRRCRIRGLIAWASAVNAVATRVAGGASIPSS